MLQNEYLPEVFQSNSSFLYLNLPVALNYQLVTKEIADQLTTTTQILKKNKKLRVTKLHLVKGFSTIATTRLSFEKSCLKLNLLGPVVPEEAESSLKIRV